MLGDGYIGFHKKDSIGKRKGYSNAHYGMTLKIKDYIYYLWNNFYKSICTNTEPTPWPNPKTGLEIKQYNFKSRSLPSLTALHSKWYRWSDQEQRYIKIVPLDLGASLTALSLAHWIMDDGFWATKEGTVYLCTDNFTLAEVRYLISLLHSQFDLVATEKRRKQNDKLCWRIRFSGKAENLEKLIKLVRPHMIEPMLYKINLGPKPEDSPDNKVK